MLIFLAAALSADPIVVDANGFQDKLHPPRNYSIEISHKVVQRDKFIGEIPTVVVQWPPHPSASRHEIEVAGFNLHGKNAREKLNILDLDVIVTPGGKLKKAAGLDGLI